MDFRTAYLHAASAKKSANINTSVEVLIPTCYQYAFDNAMLSPDAFLHCLAGGIVNCEQLFLFSYTGLDCGMLIYTKRGMGKLTDMSGRAVELKERELLFFDCRQSFSLQSTLLPWNFQICFCSGGNMDFFLDGLHGKQAPLFHLSAYSPIPNLLLQMLRYPNKADCVQYIQMQQLLNQVLTALYVSAHETKEPAPVNVPSYLIELKDHLNHHYADSFSLEDYQEYFGINKYRICREFSKYYGDPPLRYLNRMRIEAAKEMLLNTELTVHEISSNVGFDNVNHFIHLFKREMGLTPNAFKQTVPVDRPVLCSPVQ